MVLLLDDDDAFRTGLGELLEQDGHPVRAFRSLADLPPLTELAPVAAVITDYQLSDQENGLSFATRFHAAQPTVPVIILTAFGSDYLTRSVAAAAYLSLLRKPVHYDDVHQLLHQRV